MKKFLCGVLVVLVLAVPSNALSFVHGDYDHDQWDVERQNFQLPEIVPDGWYPLKMATECFDEVYVGWNEKTNEVTVCSNDLSWFYLESFKSDELPEFLVIEKGTTYCSPEYLATLISNRGFYYEGELYYFVGETVKTNMVRCRDNENFRKKVLTILFQMKMCFPDVYNLVRENLTGGIEQTYRDELPWKFSYDVDRNLVVGYIDVGLSKPICYIVSCFYNNTKANLASTIAHEAYHVHCYNLNGYIGEEFPTKYGEYVKYLFDSMGIDNV